MQELGTDAVVEANSTGHFLHIDVGYFAEISNLVNEAYLQGEESIGRILDEFGAAPCGEKQRRLIEIERAVNFSHDRAGAIIGETNHYAIGFFEIADG